MYNAGTLGTSIKPAAGMDLTSENAVKISGDLGNLFDDSEEEDEIQKVVRTI